MINVRFTPGLRVTFEKVRKGVDQELKAFGSDLLDNLRKLTPVNGGRARRGWSKRETTNKVALQNRVPYIERLEDNYSKQTKGRGILKPAIRITKNNRQRRRVR